MTLTTDAYTYVVGQLAKHGCTLNNTGQTRCPSHADKNPSLTVTRKDDRVLLHCHAGCTTEQVCDAIGIKTRDLYNKTTETEERPRIVHVYTYRNTDGTPVYEKVRYQPKTFKQRRIVNGQHVWGLGDVPRVLYNLDKFTQWAITGKPLFVVEGERDADTLTRHGYQATTLTDGAGKWRNEYTQQIRDAGFDWVVAIADNDAPGRKHTANVAANLQSAGIAVTVALPTHGKDITDQISELGAAGLADQLEYPTDWQTWLEDSASPLETANALEPLEQYGWVDISSYLNGTAPEIVTTIGHTDTNPLLYPGRIHTIAGEPGMGKTWVANIITSQELAAGHAVAWIDLEDNPATLIKRLRQLSTPNLHLLKYADPQTKDHTLALHDQLDGLALIVVDAMAEIVSQSGADPNDNAGVANVISQILRPLTATGAAILIIDHVAKTTTDNNRWAIGAQHKLAAVDGAAYILDTEEAISRGRETTLKLKIAKDRPGHVGPMKTLARLLHVAATEGGDITWNWQTPGPDSPAARQNRRRHDIYEYVASSLDPVSQRMIERDIKGKAVDIRDDVRALITHGYLKTEEGKRGSMQIKTAKYLPADSDISHKMGAEND